MSTKSFFEIMAVTGVGQEMKLCIHETFDVIIKMKFFCVLLIGYGGRASAGVITLRKCLVDMEMSWYSKIHRKRFIQGKVFGHRGFQELGYRKWERWEAWLSSPYETE
jgi:hypothetical protein